jgi:hypothetical protein
MVGLDGVKHFSTALKYLKRDINLSLNISSDESVITADLNNDTILGHIQILVAYALESLPKYECVTLEIKNCHNRWLVFSQALRIAKKGLNARFSWNNSSNNDSISYCISANDELPTLCKSKSDSSDVRSLKIEISKNKIASNCEASDIISASTLKNSFNKSVENGLVIDLEDWNNIKEVSKAIYVASSEKSKNDAGGVVTL